MVSRARARLTLIELDNILRCPPGKVRVLKFTELKFMFSKLVSYSLRQKSLGHFNKRCFFPSRAPLVPLKVVYRSSVTKSCTPTLRGQGDPRVSQPF